MEENNKQNKDREEIRGKKEKSYTSEMRGKKK